MDTKTETRTAATVLDAEPTTDRALTAPMGKPQTMVHEFNQTTEIPSDEAEDPDTPITLTKEQQDILLAELSDTELDVKPDVTGAVFVTHTVCRDRLHRAFGPLGWKITPVGQVFMAAGVVFRKFQLFFGVNGRWQAGPAAFGEQPWLGDRNANFTFGDAMEGVESIGLSRCCKRIGMAISRKRAEQFKTKACVRVFVSKKDDQSTSVAWRRIEAAPLFGEYNVVPDSPNVKTYQKPPAPYWMKDRGGNGGDDRKPEARALPAAKPAQATKPAAPAPTGPRIDEAQQRAMWNRARKGGISEEALATALKTKWHYERSADITTADYAKILAWIDAGGD